MQPIFLFQPNQDNPVNHREDHLADLVDFRPCLLKGAHILSPCYTMDVSGKQCLVHSSPIVCWMASRALWVLPVLLRPFPMTLLIMDVL